MCIVNNLKGFVTPRSDNDGAANSGGCSFFVTLEGADVGWQGTLIICDSSAHLLEKKQANYLREKRNIGKKLRFKAPQKNPGG